MNIGVLGGTFDPIHNGHILIAEEIRAQLKVDEVIFVPAGQPRLRLSDPVATAEDRVQMVRLAIAGTLYFSISTIEVERAGPSYTVDTISELRGQLSTGDELFFILGWDSLAEIPHWKEPQRMIEMCRLVAVPRPGYTPPDIEALETAVSGLSQNVVLMDRPLIDISATDIRERVEQGFAISHLVPEPVDRYIREHGLYAPA